MCANSSSIPFPGDGAEGLDDHHSIHIISMAMSRYLQLFRYYPNFVASKMSHLFPSRTVGGESEPAIFPYLSPRNCTVEPQSFPCTCPS